MVKHPQGFGNPDGFIFDDKQDLQYEEDSNRSISFLSQITELLPGQISIWWGRKTVFAYVWY